MRRTAAFLAVRTLNRRVLAVSQQNLHRRARPAQVAGRHSFILGEKGDACPPDRASVACSAAPTRSPTPRPLQAWRRARSSPRAGKHLRGQPLVRQAPAQLVGGGGMSGSSGGPEAAHCGKPPRCVGPQGHDGKVGQEFSGDGERLRANRPGGVRITSRFIMVHRYTAPNLRWRCDSQRSPSRSCLPTLAGTSVTFISCSDLPGGRC